MTDLSISAGMEAVEKLKVIKQWLTGIAAKETIYDGEDGEELEVCIDDYAGGNVDDAFWCGHRTGSIDEARELLAKFFPES